MKTENTEKTKYQSISKGFGITGLVLGILTLLISFIPLFGLFAVFVGIIAVCVSVIGLIIALKHNYEKGLIIGAIICSLLGCGIAYSQYVAINSFVEETLEKTEKPKEEAVSKEFITISGIQLGDNINNHKDFLKENTTDSPFQIFIKRNVTINKLEGELILYTYNSIVEKIEFESSESFMGSVYNAQSVFDAMLEERKNWIKDAMYNFNIPEWDMRNELAEYKKQEYTHKYKFKKLEALGTPLGWSMSYFITSNKAEKIQLEGKINNLDFGSNQNNQTQKKKEEDEVNDLIGDKTAEQIDNLSSEENSKFGYSNGTNIIIRESHSTNSKIMGSIKDSGEKLEILESYNPNQNMYLIKEDVEVITNSGVSYILQKGKSIEVLSKKSGGVSIQFKDKDLNTLGAIVDEKNIEKSAGSVWYKIKRDNNETGWVYGKFISQI